MSRDPRQGHRDPRRRRPARWARSTSAASARTPAWPTSPRSQLGDYVIIHVGFAISRVDEEEALKTLEILCADGRPGPGRAGHDGSRAWTSRRWSPTTARRSPAPSRHRRRERPEAAREVPRRVPRPGRSPGSSSPRSTAITTRPWTLMEVCGGQTHTIVKQGIDEALPDGVRMIHGPGCPVCVTPLEQIDKALAIAARPDVIFTSYGDMLRVPGSTTDLLALKARGADVRIVYSPLDALQDRAWPTRTGRSSSSRSASRRRRRPTRWRSREAARRGIDNFSVLVSHVLVPPAMIALLESPDEPGPGVPGRRPRLRGHGLDRVRADRREVPRARSSSPASSRSTCSRAS